MTVFLAGAGLLFASLIVQLLVWRLALPRSQTLGLLLIFALVPPCVLGAAALGGHGLSLPAPEAARLVLGYVSFALAYVVLYSAIEHQSPTLAIVLRVAQEGSGGCPSSELFASFAREDPMSNRIDAMELGGYVQLDGDVVKLTSHGRRYAELFEYAGGLFGLAKGG